VDIKFNNLTSLLIEKGYEIRGLNA